MRLARVLTVALGSLLLAPVIAFAAPGDGAAGDGIALTVHDFYGGSASATSTVGLCTYCHTPHKAQSTRLLWNHTLSSSQFTWDVASTTGGTPLPTITSSYTGPTIKCLSCHDGTVAIGDVSWYKEQTHHAGGNGPLTGDTIGQGTLIGNLSDNGTSEFLIANGSGAGNMKGNHPVAIPFPFGNAASTYNLIATGAAVNVAEWQPDPQVYGIRLFNDGGGSGGVVAGAAAGNTGIECSSCHDPHNGATVKEDLFVRGTLSGDTTDYICLKCHAK